MPHGGEFQRDDVSETPGSIIAEKRAGKVVKEELEATGGDEGEGVDAGGGDGEEGGGGEVARGRGGAGVLVREGKAGGMVVEGDRRGTEERGVQGRDVGELFQNARSRAVLRRNRSGREGDLERVRKTLHVQLKGNCLVVEVAKRGDLHCLVVEVNHARSWVHDARHRVRKRFVKWIEIRIRVWNHENIGVIEVNRIVAFRSQNYA